LKDQRNETILTSKNSDVAEDGPDSLVGSELEIDELRQLLGRIKADSVPEQLSEDLIAPASSFIEEELPDQIRPRTLDPRKLIESISRKALKSHILLRLSEDLPPLMVEKNKTMIESILQDVKERFGLNRDQIKALREDIEAARNDKQRSSESDGKSLEARKEEIESWLPIAEPLISSDNILVHVMKVLKSYGLTGHEKQAKIVYLALTSRISDRPVNIVIKGPSSTGKNHIVKQVIRLFPESAYSNLSSMSDKALIHWDESLSHRYLVIAEAAGMDSQFVSYIIRTLLSEGIVRYVVGNKVILKEGPTGFITTTTGKLNPENETRMLTLQTDESSEQTQAVMFAQARHTDASKGDLAPFLALQRIIELEKAEVFIPYGEKLAKAINPAAIRLRRDFPTVLTLIMAHAVLHAHNRERDTQGRVIATIADYKVVYDLVADLLDAMVNGADLKVERKIKETVAAVVELSGNGNHNHEGVNIRRIATQLKISDKTACRRVKSAIIAGYLINKETRKRAEARIVLGNPIAEHILPPPEFFSASD
jgi:hypothetical protein